MKRNQIMCVVFASILLVVLATGCGIKKEIHAQKLQELAQAQADLEQRNKEYDEVESDYKGCMEEKNAITERINKLTENMAGLTTELEKKDTELEQRENYIVFLEKIKKANDLREAAMKRLLSDFAELIASGKLTIGVTDGRMVIKLPSSVLFRFGKTRLSRKGVKAVKEVADILAKIDPNRKFQVAGHTDSKRKPGKRNPNWVVSYRRAKSVFEVLKDNGVEESRLSIAAYAEYSPAATNETEEGREKNRRIEIVLLPTTDEVPFQQLKTIIHHDEAADTIEKKAIKDEERKLEKKLKKKKAAE